MFENLFKRPHAVRRHTTYPLLEERLLYLRHLSDRHFSRNSLRMVAQYLLVITDHLDLPGHAGEVVTHAAIEAAAAHWAANGMQRHRRRTGDPHRRRVLFARHATRWLRFLGRLEKPVGDPGPCDDLIASFRDHMKRERGLSERTVDLWGRLAGDFLKRLGATRASLSEMTIADIGDGLTEIAAERKYARRTIRQHASALRAFFRGSIVDSRISGEPPSPVAVSASASARA